MDNISFSICISVYNAEKYITRCIDSVLAQKSINYDIILVNDGSTDKTLNILNDYKELHRSKIKLITQKNKGLAQGRHTGVINSTGDYIVFLDADDCLFNNAIAELNHCAKKLNPDIIEYKSERSGNVISSNYSNFVDSCFYLKEYFETGSIQPMLWLRAYKRELFDDKTFPEMFTNNEDIFAFPCLLHKANTVFILDKVLHKYNDDNEDSIMNFVLSNNDSV